MFIYSSYSVLYGRTVLATAVVADEYYSLYKVLFQRYNCMICTFAASLVGAAATAGQTQDRRPNFLFLLGA